MRKTALIGLLAAGLAVPVAAQAQVTASVTTPSSTTQVVLDPQWLGIAAGAVVGAAVFSLAFDAKAGIIVGGIVGGYLTDIWMRERGVQIVSAPKG